MGCVQGRPCYGFCFCCSRDSGAGTGAGPGAGEFLSTADVPSAGLRLLYGCLSHGGRYPESPARENQDKLCIHTSFASNPSLHFFGVFDGHGESGGACAAFARDTVPRLLSSLPGALSDPPSAFLSAFLAANDALHAANIDDSMSGTTAVTALVAGGDLFVANVGDSRAVAGVRDPATGRVLARDLSNDQTPFRRDECERVRRCGARVLTLDQVEGVKDPDIQSWGDEESDDGDPPRLWLPDELYPGTAFTRSVGDSIAESIGVTAVPEVTKVTITPELLFFVLASDGVFEFLSSQAVVDMVAKFNDPQDACSEIVTESCKMWLKHETRIDDITIIIVHIKSLDNSDGGGERPGRSIASSTAIENGASSKQQSCTDSPGELSLACVAPSPVHTDRNVN